MIRTQIQITPEQSRGLKRLAVKEGISVAEMIRQSIEPLLQSGSLTDLKTLRTKAKNAAGKFFGSAGLATNHDDHLNEAIST